MKITIIFFSIFTENVILDQYEWGQPKMPTQGGGGGGAETGKNFYLLAASNTSEWQYTIDALIPRAPQL